MKTEAGRLTDHQLSLLRLGLQRILAGHSAVAVRLRQFGVESADDVRSLADLAQLPLMSRTELVADQTEFPPYGTNLTEPIDAYVRVSESAGTTSAPLRWLDTPADIEWLTQLWHSALLGVGIRPGDRVLHALHAEPLACVEGVDALAALSIVARTPQAAIRALNEQSPTVLLTTPTQALRMANSVAGSSVRLAVLCGEPGASVPSTRRRVEERLGVPCADLYWLMELGPVGWDCSGRAGVHLNERAFIVETLILDRTVDLSELVVTSLGRWGMPAIRFRTGDIVRLGVDACGCGSAFAYFNGGVLGRVDELLDMRGKVLLPSMVENVVRRHPAVVDYRLHAYDVRGASEVAVEIEPDAAIATEGDRARVAAEVSEDLRRSLGLRLQCESIASGSLPRDDPRLKRIDRRKRKSVAS